MRKLLSIITVCVLAAAVLAGCGVLQKFGWFKGTDEELHPASSIVMNEDEAKKLTDKYPVRLYFAGEDNKLRLEIRYIMAAEAKKSTSNLASTIVKELINGPANGSRLKATIPTGTALRGPVSVKDGVATVDLSKEFKDKHPGGKDAEQLTIYSIVNSLTELKDIQEVKFLVNGKVSKEYKGNYQFDLPFPRSPALINNSAVEPTSAVPQEQEADVETASPEIMDEESEETYLEMEILE